MGELFTYAFWMQKQGYRPLTIRSSPRMSTHDFPFGRLSFSLANSHLDLTEFTF
jgi:hypothetical protein